MTLKYQFFIGAQLTLLHLQQNRRNYAKARIQVKMLAKS